MKQNVYDDPEFFQKYSAMPRSVHGLDAATEWPVLRSLLPPLRDARVLDLGCGFGAHARYACEQQAQSVVAVDLSEKMLARAAAGTNDSRVEYVRCAIEDTEFAPNAFDVVISSLALHYVERLDLVCQKLHRNLVPGGAFVLSVEHPMFTALAGQQWYCGASGERLHWPIDGYSEEGIRHTQWMADDVVKYHRTVATYVNMLLDAGFTLRRILEPQPSPEQVLARPELRDECRRPMFLLIAALNTP